ncbi:hypothetical protein DM867_11235 [Halosegnis rubeus]|jgi:hypothetical protein|uniref:DUF8145 domain-containing protein n=1 Tax=Halosegnis rubeus TaxID=2212850 RepID=A0A5N5U9B3_9EURY|nr:hypothetical protein [Halosegnis rubeus]KAB7512766.1 hypothetical protein DM867_11235 [Halosegnis rubeus]KAB7512883.1 hypothetical protein DMP03_13090 [Halosegnis rubeus]KAB7515098.1 hypothetical protein DP108_11790 [Halosegnis rubeus]
MAAREEPPARCPVCETMYDSVSVHESGLMVNLLDNERYRRVCFEPATRGATPIIRFYHHTHEQADTESTDDVRTE